MVQSKLGNWTKQKEKDIWSFLCSHWLAGLSVTAGKREDWPPEERSCLPCLTEQKFCLPVENPTDSKARKCETVIYPVLMIKYLTITDAWIVYYTVVKHDGHLRTRENSENTSRRRVFSSFFEYSQMSGEFYHIVIHGLGFFICFMI